MMLAKLKVIEHYTKLRNTIDIETEKKLNYTKTDEDDHHEVIAKRKMNKMDEDEPELVNERRFKMIEKINEIEKLNLDYLKSNNSKLFVKPEHYFAPKYCFLVKENRSFFCDLSIVVLRHYLEYEELQEKEEEGEEEEEKDEYYNQIDIAQQTVIQRVEFKNYINDFSNQMDIKSIKLSLDYHLRENDFDLVEKLIDVNQIESLLVDVNPHFNWDFEITANCFSKFRQLSVLSLTFQHICSDYYFDIQPNTFVHLSSLIELSITPLKKTSSGLFNGLKQLKKLELRTNELESSCFYELENLKSLSLVVLPGSLGPSPVLPAKVFERLTNLRELIICGFLIESSCFIGIEKLNCLCFYFKQEYINLINEDVFSLLSNLEKLKLQTARSENCSKEDPFVINLTNLKRLKLLETDFRGSMETGSFNNLSSLVFFKSETINYEIQNLRNFECLECLDISFKDINLSETKDLDLPKLKYLKTEQHFIPVFKNSCLEYISPMNSNSHDLKNLKDVLLDQSSSLVALNLFFYNLDNVDLNKEFFMSFKNLIFFKSESFQNGLEIEEFLKKNQIIENSKIFRIQNCYYDLVMVSIYDNEIEMIEKHLTISNFSKEILIKKLKYQEILISR
ncbi:unnamed protein product [Brachionus calyciflorus]|uniref:Uncharacterized protein n=1 Tax=Brachionus calyciflorus TaxID=104777 RepID=A0A813TEF4_9BILA|nr:unnamed protein product [Brachionus calyciflorus]